MGLIFSQSRGEQVDTAASVDSVEDGPCTVDNSPPVDTQTNNENTNCASACSKSIRQLFHMVDYQRTPSSEERELLSLTNYMLPETSGGHRGNHMNIAVDNVPFALHSAVMTRDVEKIHKLIEIDPNCAKELNLSGETALHLACKIGDYRIVDEMLNLGCDPNICTGIGIPVHSVLQGMKQGHISEDLGVRLVELFLAKGCDLTLSNAEDQNSKTVLLCAAEYGSPACMDLLIRAGASVNTMDHNCFSPLYMSTIRGDLNCVKLLLQHRSINVNVQDSSGRTPLIAALITIISSLTYDRLNNDVYNTDAIPDEMIVLNRNNRIAIVEALLAAGADPNIVDRQGRNALGLAFLTLELEAEQDGDQYQLASSSSQSSVRPPEQHVYDSKYSLLVRLLVMYGAVLPPHLNLYYFCKAPGFIISLFKEVKYIIENKLVEKPAKLAHMCRMKIRAHLAALRNLDKIDRLPVPKKLCEYIQFEYF